MTIFACKEPAKPTITTGGDINIVVHDIENSLDTVISDVDVVHLDFKNSKTPFDIGGVSKILYADHKYFVLDGRYNIIKAFDEKGAYLFDIGTLGVIDSAFIRVEDLVFNSHNKTIWVVCNNPSKIAEFNLNGKFIKTIKPGFFASSVAIIDPGTYYYYVNQNESLQSQKKNLLFTNEENKIIEKYFDFPEGDPGMIEYTGGLYKTHDSSYFNPPFTGQYYLLRGESIKEKYNIQFVADSLKIAHPWDYYPGKLFIETDRYLIFNLFSPSIIKTVVYNRITGKVYSSNGIGCVL